jgi:hypothetical protein
MRSCLLLATFNAKLGIIYKQHVIHVSVFSQPLAEHNGTKQNVLLIRAVLDGLTDEMASPFK